MVSVTGISLAKLNNVSRLSFGGHNLSTNDSGEKVYKFFIPKVYFDNAKVVLKKFELDENGNIDVTTDYPEDEIVIPKGQNFVEVNPMEIDLEENEVLGYKFVIDNADYTDKHRSITTPDGNLYNIADMLSTDVLQTPKSIYHIIPATFNPSLKTTNVVNGDEIDIISDDKTARMNHFLKYDTSLQDIIAKVPYMKKLGFRRVLATPIFGQDNISSHGYWTNNPFQITERYGSIKDFADLQIALFKNSMGYIADGAFTNEGLTGIHIRDIIRHGENSPFIKWFETFNYPSSNLKFGVLPDTKTAYDNFDIRIVNSPVIWTVDRTGKPIGNFGAKNKAYNPNKETFIQIYDRRLTSQEQLKKDEVFNTYAIRNTNNPDAISDWMDSVQPYSFPVNPATVEKKAKLAKKDAGNLPKAYLMRWENFELAKAKDSAGVLLWNGNKDIAKLRFVFPAVKKHHILENAQNPVDAQMEIAKTQKATEDVQDYIASVGEFWTNKTAKILREYIASELSEAKTPQEFKQKIVAKAQAGALPVAMRYITEKQIENALNNSYEASNMLQVPNTVADALKEYPLEALEVSDDLTSVMAYPQFKEKFDAEVLPLMEKVAAQILRKLDLEKLSCGNFYKDVRLTNSGVRNLQLISDDIKRFLLVKSMEPEIKVEDILSYSNTSLSKLKDISAKKLSIDSKNPDVSTEKLLSLMKMNINHISPKDVRELVERLSKRLSKITPDSLKVADLIIDKSEAGLNWRIDAAKDIADMESFVEGEANMDETWGEIFDFWKRFNSGVKLYNNHSYKIGEFTDTAVSYTETSRKMRNSGDIEQKLIEQGGFTTQTNYSYLFDFLQRYYSAMAEYNADKNTPAADLISQKFFDGWEGVPGYLFSGNKKNIVFSHMSVGNHDKQRIAHTLFLNAFLVYKNYWDKYGNKQWSVQEENEVKEDLIKSSIHKSGYCPLIEHSNFNEVFKYISQKNLAKLAAYTDAFSKAVYPQYPADKADRLMEAYTMALDTIASRDCDTERTFFYKNFEATYDDIVKTMAEQGNDYASEMKDLCHLTHKFLTEPARQRGVELAKLMVALPGNPTLYAGDELLELGGEEKAKNLSVQNRNRLHWENLTNPQYAHVKEFKDEIAKIYNLRNDENLTSLVNGDTIMLKKQGDKAFRDVIGMYRYNDHDDAIILMHNIGYNSFRHFSHNEPVQIEKIDLTGDDSMRTGLPHQKHIPAGTMYINALDPSQKFVVGEDGFVYNTEYRQPIILRNSIVILKRI